MKDFFHTIKELRKDPKGRAILFFGFYFLFFFFLFVIAHVGERRPIAITDYEIKPYSFITAHLSSNNYSYEYQMEVDSIVSTCSGQKNGDRELFSFQDKEYFKNGNSFFVKDGLWIKSENPLPFSSFLDLSKVFDLIDSSYYESTVSYESGKKVYNFLVSTNTINEKFHETETDYMEEANRIVVSTDSENRVNQIVFLLDSYGVLDGLCQSNLKIELQFDQFGEILEIESPIGE